MQISYSKPTFELVNVTATFISLKREIIVKCGVRKLFITEAAPLCVVFVSTVKV